MDPLGPIDRVQARMIDLERAGRAAQVAQKSAQVAANGIPEKVVQSALSRVPAAAPKMGMLQAAKELAMKAAPIAKGGVPVAALAMAPSVGGAIGYGMGQALHPVPGETVGGAMAEGFNRYGWTNPRGMDK